MNILGIAFLADASAVVLRDGQLVAAVSEERLNRVKLWNGVPRGAIQAVLKLAGLTLDEIDVVATHGAAPPAPDPGPFEEKERRILDAPLSPQQREAQLTHLRTRLEHERMVLGSRTPTYLEEIRALGRPVQVVGHHEAHAASAYFGSGWEGCLALTADGWGEDGSSTVWRAAGGRMSLLTRSHTFDSLGYFYGSITKSLGFVPHRHEGKVLGLAAYCESPQSYPAIRAMIDYDGRVKRFIGRMEHGLYVPRFENPALREFVRRFPREDVAASAQRSLEEVVCTCVADQDGGAARLAVAGGIFANVKLNQRIRELANVRNLFVFPNMGDGGLSVGAAWLVHARETGRMPEPLRTLYLGQEPGEREIEDLLASSGLRCRRVPDLEERIAALLAEGHVVARCAGRMEYGPRALGNRSILCRATDPSVNDWLNRALSRSEFMPFAPATLAEHAAGCYVGWKPEQLPSRHMTMTYDCTPTMRADAPAAVHVDGTARPQVVFKDDHPSFHAILSAYHRRTGLSSVINTSFNMHEEPIVCTADDAVRAFRASGLPYLALGNFLVESEDVL
ncbi:MAG: carbamoyl transferase [Candidatus Omnitrophica bacterium]|nr:carbamoyl transferase [Candidatus Omnitrophota bacterium]